MVTAVSPQQKALKRTLFERLAWGALCGAALLVGVVSLRYLLPRVPNPLGGTNLLLRRPWLVTHAVSAAVALIAGPWQFFNHKHSKRFNWHRWNGRVYVVAVVIGWLTSIPIALHAQTGRVAQAGFVCLGLAWIYTTVFALSAIWRGDVAAHRRWMIRSYALSAAAISLRIMIPLSMVARIPFDVAYPVIAWSCWLVNLGLLGVFRLYVAARRA